ncbi:SDR family oxidoreductase [Conexibacter sp. JD483]|uniref:SDR family oxidoreductase n=1 Tax=unclassified Conexibacter TaxID=2627773 RepID=UPI002726C533|nr:MULTISPECIES: SDR family oxidoreductase [unclassified Conexibacter]MDO8189005.1 SDR family oxidoreductase [Conexibacter sp. CPCC 205706]MDO8201405.1 SDR family oxidoreductase [Conexibacter sp. CPCC 205762]MDR9371708.1 SDR family oxidoreductase [Conexibacter sp. JD483]
MSVSEQHPSRVAIVTGASGGIGGAVATRLAADGQAIVAAYSGNAEPAVALVAAIAADGGRAVAVGADLSGPEGAAALFDAAEREFGGVDVVAHAAGVMPLPTPLAEFDWEQVERVVRVNALGTLAIAQQAVRRLRDGGALITFSSSVLALGFPGYAPYAASKGAVEALTPILARELRGRDVTVNCVAPGPTATPLFLDGKDEATIARLAAQPPLERLGLPADSAELVSFLAGPGRWVNGQLVRVNGGIV